MFLFPRAHTISYQVLSIERHEWQVTVGWVEEGEGLHDDFNLSRRDLSYLVIKEGLKDIMGEDARRVVESLVVLVRCLQPTR